MKKTAITFLTLLYLVSSVGFGISRHICLSEESDMVCCTQPFETENPGLSKEEIESACCESMPEDQPGFSPGGSSTETCCVTTYTYQKVESPSKPSTDENSEILALPRMANALVQLDQTSGYPNQFLSPGPSSHFTPVLLI